MPDPGDDNPTQQTPGPTPRKILTPSRETKAADDKAKKNKKQRPEPTTFGGKLWHNWVKPVGSVIIVVVLLRSTLIDWNDVPTGSMEPEIQVGDRIAVNRLAYGLQCPLTGPTIGIPFTPLQWNNPLDGIPQLAWGSGPARGDIVTFWNPVTKVRMVKRIVAIPGDTIAMTGGKLTINGTAATYTDVTSTPARQTRFEVMGPFGKQVITKDLEDLEETLLGETRIVQQIKERWLTEAYLFEKPGGERQLITGPSVTVPSTTGPAVTLPVQQFLQLNPQIKLLAQFRDGSPLVDGVQVSYNELAAALLKPYETGKVAQVLSALGLSVAGHELRINGKAVPFEFFRIELEKNIPSLSTTDRDAIVPFHYTLNAVLHSTMMTCFGPITLNQDQYFMVGDNRNNSHDGRMFGSIARSEITGEAFAVAFSFKDNKMFAIPPDPDFSRFFKDLE